jgi:hypothetical protein
MIVRRPTPQHAATRLGLLLTLAAALVLLLVAAAPALAVSSTRAFIDDQITNRSQSEVELAGNYAVWTQKDPNGPTYQYQVWIGDLATGLTAPLHTDLTHEEHGAHLVLQADGTITVVWTEYTSDPTYHSHTWIWQGTEQAGQFVPSTYDGANTVFPEQLLAGYTDSSSGGPVESDQDQPAIGFVAEPESGVPGNHVVVAWRDYRDFGYASPQIYYADLTLDGSYLDGSQDKYAYGAAVDPTDPWARGQQQPAVGPGGISWLDDRWSYWAPDLLGTDVRFADLSAGSPPADTPSVSLYEDTSQTGDSDALTATATGAAFMHHSTTGGRWQPYKATIGGTTSQLTSVMLPSEYMSGGVATTLRMPVTASYFALSGLHGDSATGDEDVFFYDPSTGARTLVCANLSSTSPASNDARTMGTQADPSISLVPNPAPSAAATLPFERVIWVDGRDNTPPIEDEQEMMQLYEAFIPRIGVRITHTTLLLRGSFSITATVQPNFTGLNVTLQLVKPGVPTAKVLKTLVSKPLAGTSAASSAATFTWKPTLKGTYYLRASFGGDAASPHYYQNGTTTGPANGLDHLVPFVANVSKVIKVVVK